MPSMESQYVEHVRCIDDGLYYDFWDEEMPVPKTDPVITGTFSIKLDFDEDELPEFIEEERKDRLDNPPGFPFPPEHNVPITCDITAGDHTEYFWFFLPRNWGTLISFLENVKNNTYARYADQYGDYNGMKLCAWPLKNGDVRFGMLDGRTGPCEMDVVLNKDTFVSEFENILRRAKGIIESVYTPDPCPVEFPS